MPPIATGKDGLAEGHLNKHLALEYYRKPDDFSDETRAHAVSCAICQGIIKEGLSDAAWHER